MTEPSWSPECAAFERCGGCPAMAVSPSAEKEQKLRELWRGWAAADLGERVPLRWTSSPLPLGYRNRLRLKVTDTGTIAFFNGGKRGDCPVVESTVLEGMRELQALEGALRTELTCVSHLEVRGRDTEGRLGLLLSECIGSEGAVDPSLWREKLGKGWLVGVEGSESIPSQTVALPQGVTALVPLNSFRQVNTKVNQLLVQYVLSIARDSKARTFLDLFMGAGNFSLPMLALGLEGMGLESHFGAVQAACESARVLGLNYSQVEAKPAFEKVSEWAGEGRQVDIVVSDPPRAGLKELAPKVASLAARTLVLCSCGPKNLWADLARIVPLGFQVKQLHAFDMFPRTRHLEVVAWLERIY